MFMWFALVVTILIRIKSSTFTFIGLTLSWIHDLDRELQTGCILIVKRCSSGILSCLTFTSPIFIDYCSASRCPQFQLCCGIVIELYTLTRQSRVSHSSVEESTKLVNPAQIVQNHSRIFWSYNG